MSCITCYLRDIYKIFLFDNMVYTYVLMGFCNFTQIGINYYFFNTKINLYLCIEDFVRSNKLKWKKKI